MEILGIKSYWFYNYSVTHQELCNIVRRAHALSCIPWADLIIKLWHQSADRRYRRLRMATPIVLTNAGSFSGWSGRTVPLRLKKNNSLTLT